MKVIPAIMLLALASADAAPGPATGEKGLLGWWKFDEGRGDLAEDSSPAGNDADVVGAKWVRGAFGTALHFTGRGSWVSVPQVGGLDGADELTVEAWVLWESTGQYPNIVTGGTWSPGGFLLFVSNRSCSFRLGRPGHKAREVGGGWKEVGVPLLTGFELGRWYHLAATYKRPRLTTYVDGKRVATGTWNYPIGYGGDLQIGRWAGAQACHQGLIDEVKVYNRALTAAEIQGSFSAEAPRRRASSNPVAYEFIPAEAQRIPVAAMLETNTLRLTIDARGRCTGLVDRETGKNYLAQPAPLVTVQAGERVLRRTRCSYSGHRLTFVLGRNEATVVVGVEAKGGYLVFELLSVQGTRVDQVTFVNLPVKPPKYAMPFSGAATYDAFIVCLRALNIDTEVTTRGGLRAGASRRYRLQGAKAALVGCAPGRILPVLQAMVEAEGVPQSPLGGPWARDANGTRGSYLFARISEDTVDWWIDLAKRGGFQFVHFNSWWKTLGHYEPNPVLFPHGLEGVAAAVRKIHAAGLKAGMHTLTGCISPRDPWVTPIPDPRLAADARYTLAADIDEHAAAVPVVEPPGDHDTVWGYATGGNVVRVGQELIQYAGISHQPPYAFTLCKRGVFGTHVTAHAKGERVDHLRQRYGAFYPGEASTLVGEVADRIARVFNGCGFDQIYMDGAEGRGNWHAIQVMRDAIYRRLRRPAVVEASCWDHWSWYYHSRVGAWDHPKWGLKQFTDRHMADIPRYRKGGLVQAQLGWWAVLGPTWANRAETPDEMEYFCGKTLAHDAPMSMQGIGASRRPANARVDEYLTRAGQYERLRLAHYFPDSLLQELAVPGREFRLRQSDSGEWTLVPSVYRTHKVTGHEDGSDAWTVANPFDRQPLRLRLEALYAAAPYQDATGIVVAGAGAVKSFTVRRTARDVRATLRAATGRRPGEQCLRFQATSARRERRGAWAQFGIRFTPLLNLHATGALGLWVRGDGKGELLNVQLVTPREYMHCYSEQYVPIDFTGWRYVQLHFRERDADKYDNYVWPYFGQHDIFRTSLNRAHVGELNLYLNELPPGESAAVELSAVKALPVRSITFDHPTLEINGRPVVVPVALRSGDYVELDPSEGCRLFDARGELKEWVEAPLPLPMVKPGANALRFRGMVSPPLAARARVTVIATGHPLRGKAPDSGIDWRPLRDEYALPRTVLRLDGKQNRWKIVCRPNAGASRRDIRLGLELQVSQVGATADSYRDARAFTLESFDDLSFFADSPDNRFARFVYDGKYKGIAAKPGVTQELTQSTANTHVGKSCARYTATSTLANGSGWSARGRRYQTPLDLSAYAGIGFWLHGDGRGELFKLQLRDTSGGWFDMYTRVDFTGWRYREFDLSDAKKLDAAHVEYLLLYFNGLPAQETVTCYVDDIRALPRVNRLRRPSFSVDGHTLAFPTDLGPGDRLVYDGRSAGRVFRKAGRVPEQVTPEGSWPLLRSGPHEVVLKFAPGSPRRFRVAATVIKHYP